MTEDPGKDEAVGRVRRVSEMLAEVTAAILLQVRVVPAAYGKQLATWVVCTGLPQQGSQLLLGACEFW